jgi:hypothetical protein
MLQDWQTHFLSVGSIFTVFWPWQLHAIKPGKFALYYILKSNQLKKNYSFELNYIFTNNYKNDFITMIFI